MTIVAWPHNHQMQLTSGGSLEVARTGRRFAPPFVRASFLSRRSQLIWVFYGRMSVAPACEMRGMPFNGLNSAS